MGANRPRRHHFVPEMLLRNFCDDEGFLWVGDRRRGKCYRSKPGKVFVKKNLNTSHVWKQGTDSYEYEQVLARIESDANPALSSVIQQVREGCDPRLDPDLDRKLKVFLIAMARRTPESQKSVFGAPGREFEEAFDSVVKKRLGEAGFEVPDQGWLDREPEVLRIKQKMKGNLSANFAAGDHDILRQDSERFVREAGWGVALICMPKRSFVIGSRGFTILPEGSSQGRSLLPVAHDVALLVTAFPGRGFRLCLDRQKESAIKSINTATAAQSDMVAGRSERLVRSLTERSNKRA